MGGGGAYNWRGNLTEGFLHYWFGGLIFGGAYFQNFTVFHMRTNHTIIVCFSCEYFMVQFELSFSCFEEKFSNYLLF